ncbi:cell division protein FtsA [Syntrophomonas erecta subsp. sporosyntropha]
MKAALAEVFGQDIHILGISHMPSEGLRKGNIIDIESTARSMDDCLNDLERITGVEILSAIVGFSGISLAITQNYAVVAVSNPNYEITPEDKERVLQSARNISLPPDKTIVQTIVRQYIVDGYDGVKDPVGMVGSRLETEVAIVSGALAGIQNLQRSTQRINLHVNQMVYNSLLAAESVLTPGELDMGVVLVDIGGETIEISYFENGSILATSVLPVGGDYVTRDLAIVLRTSIEEANLIKERNGVATPDFAKSDVMVNVKNIQGKEIKQVSQQVIADIVSARIIEIIEMIYAELRQIGCLDKIPGGLVITGGGAELTGFTEVMEQYTNIPTRIGLPENLKGIPGEFNRPQNAAVIGGLMCAARCNGVVYEESQGISGVVDRITYWFKDLFS